MRLRGGRADVDPTAINNVRSKDEREWKSMTEESELAKAEKFRQREEGRRGSSWRPFYH